MSRDFRNESIVLEELTEGTETSHYLREKKENLDSLSSGERTGNSPNRMRAKPVRVAHSGLWDQIGLLYREVGKSPSSRLTERFWKGRPQRVKAP